MKSIQTILTIILVILMIGMMPDLADAKKKKIKTETLTISADKFVPETLADNCEITPEYATSSNADPCRYWIKIPLPRKALSIKDFSYFHAGYGGSTSAVLYRCRPGDWHDYMGGVSTNAGSGVVIKLTDDTINYQGEIDKGYMYYLYLRVSGDDAYILGAEVTVTTK